MIENEVNSKTLADWLRISERSVRAMADEGIVKRAGRGRYLLKESVQAVVEHQRGIAAGRGGASQVLDLTAERARLAKEQADAQALKNAVARGELVLAEEVAQAWERLVLTSRNAMLAVPSRCGERLSLNSFQVETIDREVREALEALTNEEITDDLSESDEGVDAAAEDEAV